MTNDWLWFPAGPVKRPDSVWEARRIALNGYDWELGPRIELVSSIKVHGAATGEKFVVVLAFERTRPHSPQENHPVHKAAFSIRVTMTDFEDAKALAMRLWDLAVKQDDFRGVQQILDEEPA